jgi:RNA-directed DNA polymerase
VPQEAALAPFEEAYISEVRETLAQHIPDEAAELAATYARRLIERGLPVIFDQRHLARVSGVPSQVISSIRRDPASFYSSFRIPKRGGGSRVIESPTPELKQLQHWLQRHVTSMLRPHDAAHGFIRGRSIFTNAEPHVGAPAILKVDLRNFFGTVERRSAFRAFRFLGYSREVATLLANLTTLKGVLPQGAPTSPDLANYAAYRLDVRLSTFAARRRISYTRYADDLTFSGTLVPMEQRTIALIVRSEGFKTNDKKFQYLLPDQRQTVTGVVVNDKLNWPRQRRRWLRQEVYYLRRFGFDGHVEQRGINQARYKEFLYGHVYALHAVRPEEARHLLAALDNVDWPY